MSIARARFFSCARYFQAPATQVSFLVLRKLLLVPKLQEKKEKVFKHSRAVKTPNVLDS